MVLSEGFGYLGIDAHPLLTGRIVDTEAATTSICTACCGSNLTFIILLDM